MGNSVRGLPLPGRAYVILRGFALNRELLDSSERDAAMVVVMMVGLPSDLAQSAEARSSS
jgi:hypothetical protein